MIVCICNAISERDIDEAVENGATTMAALRAALRISSQCGNCSGCAEACLERALDGRHRTEPCSTLSGVATTQALALAG